jgi:predicted dehydrogenase
MAVFRVTVADRDGMICGMRFGLFGTGYWAAQTQGAALAGHPAAELVGVWGRDPAKAEALARRFTVRAYADVEALFADVDAIAVALPPDVQAGLAERAAQAGKHLLLDKPLALDTAAADRVVAAASRTGVASVVFFTNRFYANVAAFLSTAAQSGGWDGARVTMFASIFQPGNPYGGSPWRREKGGLWDIGPHALSVVLPVLGPVEEVVALGGPHETVYVTARHAGGPVSTMALTLDAPPAAVSWELSFHGAGGVVPVPSGEGGLVGAFGAAIDQLTANAAAGVTRHPCDVSFARDVVAILAAVDTARRTGRAQRVLPGR